MAKDYVTIKNAKYLILSNSSFAFFPAFTSETVEKVIAPKYWARHNVSDGYWASEQNIYEGFTYQDRKGRLFSAKECREELEEYKKRHGQGKELAEYESSHWQQMQMNAGRYSEKQIKRQEKKDRALYLMDKATAKVKRMLKG